MSQTGEERVQAFRDAVNASPELQAKVTAEDADWIEIAKAAGHEITAEEIQALGVGACNKVAKRIYKLGRRLSGRSIAHGLAVIQYWMGGFMSYHGRRRVRLKP